MPRLDEQPILDLGRNPVPGGEPCGIELVWKRNTTTSNCVYNTVSVTGGKVYTSDGERIHCWDLETGNPDWTFEKKGLPNLVTGTGPRG